MSQAVSQQKVWAESVYDTAIAKTQATFDPINLNASAVRIEKPDAKAVLGFLIEYAQTVTTDAENLANLIIQVTNKALGITEEEIIIPRGGNDGDANNPYTPIETYWHPFKIPAGKKLYDTEFIFKATPSVTNTGGFDISVTVVYSDQEPDSQFAMELMAQITGRTNGGKAEVDAAKAFVAANTDVVLTSLVIEAGAKQLRGIFAGINPNGITAGDPICGVMEFQSAGIKDFSPQVWPLSIAWNAALGTVAESQALSARGRYFPTRFPLPGGRITITVKAKIMVVAGAAPDTCQGVLYDR